MPEVENPYKPPEAELLPDQENSGYPRAGAGKRFLNYLFDRLGIYGLTFVIALILALAQTATQTGNTSFPGESGFLWDLAFGYGVSVLYYTLLEGLTSATPGKWITGTRVVMEDGSPLTFKAAVLRSLCRLIPFEPFSFLGDHTGWHDSITNTMVIDRRAGPVTSRRNPLAGPRPLPRQALWERPLAQPSPPPVNPPVPRPVPPPVPPPSATN